MGESDIEKCNESVAASECEQNRLPPAPDRFLRTFLPIFLILGVPAVTAIWTLIVPQYTAKAEIRVRPIIRRLPGQESMIPLYKSFIYTQLSIMRSPTVLQRVMDDKMVRQTMWFKEFPKSLPNGQASSRIERLRDGLSAVHRPKTEIIDVSFKARSAKDAAVIVNAVLDQYISYLCEMHNNTNDEIYRKLLEQHKSLEKEIQGHEKVVIKLRQELRSGMQKLVARKRASVEEAEAKFRRGPEIRQGTGYQPSALSYQLTTTANGKTAAERQPSGARGSNANWGHDPNTTCPDEAASEDGSEAKHSGSCNRRSATIPTASGPGRRAVGRLTGGTDLGFGIWVNGRRRVLGAWCQVLTSNLKPRT